MALFLQLSVSLLMLAHLASSAAISISAVISPPWNETDHLVVEDRLVTEDNLVIDNNLFTEDRLVTEDVVVKADVEEPSISPLSQFTKSTTDLLLASSSGDMSKLYQVAVGALTGAAMTKGVFAAGAVYILASFLGSLSSFLTALLKMLGLSADRVVADLAVPLLGRTVTRADLDMVETFLVDAIDVYGAWNKRSQRLGSSSRNGGVLS